MSVTCSHIVPSYSGKQSNAYTCENVTKIAAVRKLANFCMKTGLEFSWVDIKPINGRIGSFIL